MLKTRKCAMDRPYENRCHVGAGLVAALRSEDQFQRIHTSSLTVIDARD
jgi:hypothetical protein